MCYTTNRRNGVIAYPKIVPGTLLSGAVGLDHDIATSIEPPLVSYGQLELIGQITHVVWGLS